MADKKPIGSLKPFSAPAARPTTPAGQKVKGSVQTVRMEPEDVRALKLASIERGISQNDIILSAIRRELGLI